MENSQSDISISATFSECKDVEKVDSGKEDTTLNNCVTKCENKFESDNAVLDDIFLANLLSRSPQGERSKDIIELEDEAEVEKEINTNLSIQKSCEIDSPDKNPANANSTNLQNHKTDTHIAEVSIIVAEDDKQTKKMEAPSNKYRCESDSWSDDEDSSSSDTSSDSDFCQILIESSVPKKLPAIKTKGELGMEDLPLIEDLVISVNEKEMMLVGKIHAVVDKIVVIHAIKDEKPLDLDSVLFLSCDKPLGRVFDVFGPVVEPFYCVRFNNTEDIKNKGIEIGNDVFFVPEITELTSYVFLDELQKQKGSDASWKHNNEPPEEYIDFSDDEEEKAARRKRVARNRNRQFNSNSEIASKRPAITDDASIQSNFSSRTSSSENISVYHSGQFPRQNPFSSTHLASQSPAPSIQALLSATVRQPNVFKMPSPQIPYSQPQRSFPQQSLLQRPTSPLVFTSFPPPPVFGQVSMLSPLPTPISSPSPLHSPFMHSIPGSQLPVTHHQNYFQQRFTVNQPHLSQAPFSPGNVQIQQSPRFLTNPPPLVHPQILPGNYVQLNQRFPSPMPVSLNQNSLQHNNWPPIRPPTPLNVSDPILPLSVHIPHQNGSPLPMNTFQPFQQSFGNNANVNNNIPRFY